MAVVSGLFQELLLPRLNELGDEVDRVKIRGQLPRHLQSRERLWLRTADTRFYRVELLAPGTSDMYGVTVLEVDRDLPPAEPAGRAARALDAGGLGADRRRLPRVRADAARSRRFRSRMTALDLQEEHRRLHEDPQADRGDELLGAARLRHAGWRRPASR